MNSATPYEEIDDEDWQRVLDTNLKATHLGCQLFAPVMAGQSQGGSILNIGSVTAHLPLSRVFAYSASKAAVNNLTKNLAREYAPRGVRINSLNPGFFPAEQNRKISSRNGYRRSWSERRWRDSATSRTDRGRAAACRAQGGKLRYRYRGFRGRRIHRHALLTISAAVSGCLVRNAPSDFDHLDRMPVIDVLACAPTLDGP